MFKAVFSIHHGGCWGSEISLEFPSQRFSSIDVRWIDGKVSHVLKVEGDGRDFDSILTFLKGKTLKSSVLSKHPGSMIVQTLTENDEKNPSFSNVFFDNLCIPLAPTRFEADLEIWTLGSHDKKHLEHSFAIISRHHATKVDYIGQGVELDGLTEKQRQAFLFARHLGYYSWPRKVSASKLAGMMKMKKTVFFSHLRKAEIKLLSSL